MIFGKGKRIKQLETNIMKAEDVIHDILFNKDTTNEMSKVLVRLLITLDRDYAEFLLEQYNLMGTNKELPKNSNMKRRYNVIGPMIRKRLRQLDS